MFEVSSVNSKRPSDFTPSRYYVAKGIKQGRHDTLEASIFKTLPTDVTVHLLSFLVPRDLVSFSAVNRTFKHLVDSDRIWKQKCLEKYGSNLIKIQNHSYRSLFFQIPENIRCLEAEKQYHIEEDMKMQVACGMRAPPKMAPKRQLTVGAFTPIAGFKKHPNSSSQCTIKFTTPDLCIVAKTLYSFHSSTQHGGKDYLAYMNRYHNFMKLKAKYPELFLVPTYDIEQCWISHLIRPLKYRNDCLKLYGSVIPHQFLLSEEQKQFFNIALEQTAELYEKEYGVKYCEFVDDGLNKWNFSKGPFSPISDIRPVANYASNTIAILPNTNTFFNPFSFSPEDLKKDDNWIVFFNKYVEDAKNWGYLKQRFYERVYKSYERFLYMAAKYPPESGEYVHPTYTIDLFWHSHMIYPMEYYNDSLHLVGYFMDHEPWPNVDLCAMKDSCKETAKLWESEFGLNIDKEHVYDNPDTRYYPDD